MATVDYGPRLCKTIQPAPCEGQLRLVVNSDVGGNCMMLLWAVLLHVVSRVGSKKAAAAVGAFFADQDDQVVAKTF